MGEIVSAVIVALAFAACVAWMITAQRRRLARDRGLLPASGPAGHRGTPILAITDLQYVATTAHGSRLERLAVPGLAYPGRADLDVHPDGVAVRVTGADEVFLPAAGIVGIGTAGWAVGRALEQDGLLVLSWRTAGGRQIADTYLRVPMPGDDARLTAAVTRIAPAAAPDHHDDTAPLS